MAALGNDQLVGGLGYDSLLGGAGDDTLDAAAPGDQDPELENGWDRLVGGEGADTFLCSGGDKVIDPDVDDELYLGGLLMTGGTWQYVEEFETEWWVGSHGEVYWGDLIDDVFYLYSISLFDEDWNEIDGVTIVGWDAGELGITLTGGRDQLQTSSLESFDTRWASPAMAYRLDTTDNDDDEVAALIEDATGRPPAFSVLSHGTFTRVVGRGRRLTLGQVAPSPWYQPGAQPHPKTKLRLWQHNLDQRRSGQGFVQPVTASVKWAAAESKSSSSRSFRCRAQRLSLPSSRTPSPAFWP